MTDALTVLAGVGLVGWAVGPLVLWARRARRPNPHAGAHPTPRAVAKASRPVLHRLTFGLLPVSDRPTDGFGGGGGPVQRAAQGTPYWPQFSATNHFGGARNPMAIPAFYRGLAHRTSILSTLPLVAEVDGRPVGVPIEILDRPDPSEDRQSTIARMEASLVLRGEYVCVLGLFDGDGFPRALKVVDPAAARLENDGSWTIGGKRFGSGEVLHCVPMPMPGETRGVSVVELFRRTFAGEIAAADYQANFYLDGGQPTTILVNSDPDATPEDIEAMLQRYMSKVAGGRREPIAVPATIDVKPIALSNSDSQFLESRQFAMTDIANVVGVPPYFVGAPGSSSTYSNITDQRRDLLDIYLRGSLYAIERGLSSLLPDGLQAKFDPNSFLRMDPKATAETLTIRSQWMTTDEIRAVEGLPALTSSGGMSTRELAEALQKIYLSVGTVITADEARAILNRSGADLVLPAPEGANVKLPAPTAQETQDVV